MKRKILRIFFFMLFLVALWYHKLILYGLSQGKGQLEIVSASRELAEVMSDSSVPDSIKMKLQLIQAVKQFTVDSLGFEESKNYTTYYDQKGKPSLWVVTGAKPYALEPKQWSFPLLGSVPYKGFFVYEKAEKEEKKLRLENWDTNIRVAGGWSTLGWFRDPVLSNMLNDRPGELANTIVHELTHANLFVKDSVEFNENLASFFGDQGAQRFLKATYGETSPEYTDYINGQLDRRKFTDHILRGADYLDSLYANMTETLPDEDRYNSKKQMINEIIFACDTLTLYEKERYLRFLSEKQVNNAFFMSYLRYKGDFTFFERELRDKFDGNLRGYFEHFKRENN